MNGWLPMTMKNGSRKSGASAGNRRGTWPAVVRPSICWTWRHGGACGCCGATTFDAWGDFAGPGRLVVLADGHGAAHHAHRDGAGRVGLPRPLRQRSA